VAINKGPHGASFSGLATCGSVWSCPVCSARVLAGRADELGRAIDAWHADGGSIALLTLTMRHNAGHSLRECWDALSDAWGSATNGTRKVRDGQRAAGVVGWVRRNEVTHGAAGWHVHVHALLFLRDEPSASVLAAATAAIFSQWSRRLAASDSGLMPVAEQGGLDCRLLTLAEAREHVAGYLAKGVYDSRSAALELAGSSKLGRRSNRTPWAILDGAMNGDRRDVALWHEWERVSHGRRAITWSRDLRELLDLGDELADDELAGDDDAGAVAVASWTADEWRAILQARAELALLAVVDAAGSPLDAWRWLSAICRQLGLPPPLRLVGDDDA
jgi:hypothetical protein